MAAENRTILIVDDEPETLKGYQEFLKPSDAAPARQSSRSKPAEPSAGVRAIEQYNLLLASSGEAAIDLIKSELSEGRKVAAGFFDVKLEGGIDGITTINEIRKLDPSIHCVIVTAYHDRTVEEIHQLFGEQFKDQWDYLNKPFTQGEIVQKARQMVGAWNRKRQIEEMNLQLVRSERLAAVGQVARGVGHEFGNILLRIMGKTELAMMEKDPVKSHEHLKAVLSATERAGVIVRNLQSFAKPEPKMEMRKLSAPIEDTLTLIHHELVKSSVKLEKNIGQVPELKMDSRAIGQVALNLMINAIHAMPKGGTLKVTVEEGNGPGGRPGVMAKVADTGTGIPADILPRIFDVAFTTKGDAGSGLGLSISKDLVEAHGGTLTVKSEPGKGSEFTVWIPR